MARRPKVERHTFKDRDSWMALRAPDMTASVIGGLFGVHTYQTPYSLWCLKTGKTSEDPTETKPQKRGKRLENLVIDEILPEERPLWKLERPNVYLRDPSARIGATPDLYAVDPDRKGFGVVQIKTVDTFVFRESWKTEEGDVEPPLWIAIQTIIEAHLSGASWACVAALVGFNMDLHIVEVPIHKGIISRAYELASTFWSDVADGREPDPDYAADGALLARMYAEDNGTEIDLSGDNRLPIILEDREQIMARIKTDQAALEAINTEIAAKIGPHERAYVPGWRVKRPLVRRSSYYAEALEFRQLKIARQK